MCDNIADTLTGSRVCVRVTDGGCYFGTVMRVQKGSSGGPRRITLHSVRWLSAAGAPLGGAVGAGYCEGENAAQAVPGVQEFDGDELVSVTVTDSESASQTSWQHVAVVPAAAAPAATTRPAARTQDTMLMSSGRSPAAAPAGFSSSPSRPPAALMDKSLLLSEMALEQSDEKVPPVSDNVTCHVIDSSWSPSEVIDLASRLCRLPRVAVSAEGVLLGRYGRLSLLCFFSDGDNTVYCVDVVSCDKDTPGSSDSDVESTGAWSGKSVVQHFAVLLQSRRVQKVIHDSRALSDLLYHGYNLRLANVFDTQAAEVFLYSRQSGSPPTFVTNVAHTLVSRLDLPPSQVFFPRYRIDRLAEDQAAWLQRPLPPRLLTGAIYNCRHLVALGCRQMELMCADYNRCVQVYLTCVTLADEEDARNAPYESHRLPVGVCSVLGEKLPNPGNSGLSPSGSVANVLPGLDRAFQFSRNVWSGQNNKHADQ